MTYSWTRKWDPHQSPLWEKYGKYNLISFETMLKVNSAHKEDHQELYIEIRKNGNIAKFQGRRKTEPNSLISK